MLFAALETSKCTTKKLFVAPSFATNDSWETKGVRGPSFSSTKALSRSQQVDRGSALPSSAGLPQFPAPTHPGAVGGLSAVHTSARHPPRKG